MTIDFASFFKKATENTPRPYQRQLAEGGWPETLIVPTGFGKTAAVLAAWLWRLSRSETDTSRRLVYCLPMRTLVEQTETAADTWITAAKQHLGVDAETDVLMGGRTEGGRSAPAWMLKPERPAILIGTQDFLVSAGLMRAYGATRYRWPVDFALLHNDALWVFDEVQLAGAALTTSAQLEAFRRQFKTSRPSRTLWMSATLDPAWLKTVDFAPEDKQRSHDLSEEDIDTAHQLWTARKTLHPLDFSGHELGKKEGLARYAELVAKEARSRVRPGANTILFLNTVARAQAVFRKLSEGDSGPELLLKGILCPSHEPDAACPIIRGSDAAASLKGVAGAVAAAH